MADKKISELDALTTPLDTDVMPIVDNSGTPTTKKTLWSSIKTTLKAYFDTLYPAETATTIGAAIGGADNATPNDTDFVATSLTAGGILKKITWTNVKAFLKTYFDSIYQAALGFTAENSANKKTTLTDDSDAYYPSQKAVKTAVDAKAAKDILINTQTDSYTLVLTDDGKFIDMNKGSAVTLTVPKNSSVAFPVGAGVILRQKGAGQVTIAPVDGDVTINYQDGLKTTAQHAVAALLQVAANVWVATGSLEA
jgi:hypothetical protein